MFKSYGNFSSRLREETTKEMRKKLLIELGIKAVGTLENYSESSSEFSAYLFAAGIVTDGNKNRDATKLRDAAIILGYEEIVNMCNIWSCE